jgi:hypothetical protein
LLPTDERNRVKVSLLLAGAFALALILTIAATNGEPPPLAETTAPPAATEATDASVTDPEPVGDIGTALIVECNRGVCHEYEGGNGLLTIDGHGVEWWRWEALKAQKRLERLERLLKKRWEPTVEYGLRLASVAYGVPLTELRAVAWCESRFSPWARNASSTASGTFQFLDSTWARNRFGQAGFSVFDTVANSLGAAYHVSRYGWGEWVCRP